MIKLFLIIILLIPLVTSHGAPEISFHIDLDDETLLTLKSHHNPEFERFEKQTKKFILEIDNIPCSYKRKINVTSYIYDCPKGNIISIKDHTVFPHNNQTDIYYRNYYIYQDNEFLKRVHGPEKHEVTLKMPAPITGKTIDNPTQLDNKNISPTLIITTLVLFSIIIMLIFLIKKLIITTPMS